MMGDINGPMQDVDDIDDDQTSNSESTHTSELPLDPVDLMAIRARGWKGLVTSLYNHFDAVAKLVKITSLQSSEPVSILFSSVFYTRLFLFFVFDYFFLKYFCKFKS